jgi:hypothetical protein
MTRTNKTLKKGGSKKKNESEERMKKNESEERMKNNKSEERMKKNEIEERMKKNESDVKFEINGNNYFEYYLPRETIIRINNFLDETINPLLKKQCKKEKFFHFHIVTTSKIKNGILNKEFDINNDIFYLYLCLFKNGICISSISFEISKTSPYISINSDTIEKERNMKYNQILRSLIIYIFSNPILTVNLPELKGIHSLVLNWRTLYIMANYYNITIYEYADELEEGNAITINKGKIVSTSINKSLGLKMINQIEIISKKDKNYILKKEDYKEIFDNDYTFTELDYRLHFSKNKDSFSIFKTLLKQIQC